MHNTERIISDLEKKAVEYIHDNVSERIHAHLFGTRDFALEINREQNLGIDEDKIALTALCHDIVRLVEPSELYDNLKSRGVDPDSYGYVDPILLHSDLAVLIARDEIGISDEDILRAIRIHATGSDEMSVLDKLIYVADRVEPNREYDGVEELRKLAREDVVSAFPGIISSTLTWLISETLPLDYNSVRAYNHIIKDKNERAGG